MAFKYFELAMVIVGRIAGTVAIVWLIVTRLADGFFTPLLVLLVTYFGLGFQMSYKSDKPQQEAQSQPPQLPRP